MREPITVKLAQARDKPPHLPLQVAAMTVAVAAVAVADYKAVLLPSDHVLLVNGEAWEVIGAVMVLRLELS
ncbi:hypothetical protein PHIN7_13220 [Polynucleobacter sp. HIN7]|nr:hypothetical protein PHIN7_13220 [Polynucleobacter sp. HIN7]